MPVLMSTSAANAGNAYGDHPPVRLLGRVGNVEAGSNEKCIKNQNHSRADQTESLADHTVN